MAMAEELDRDRPLFNDAVGVQVKFPDHEKTLALTVRVLQGSRLAPAGSGGGQREGVLHIEITDELDPFFLYTLQVRALATKALPRRNNCCAALLWSVRVLYSSLFLKRNGDLPITPTLSLGTHACTAVRTASHERCYYQVNTGGGPCLSSNRNG